MVAKQQPMWRSRTASRQRGQALVEMALVVPMLLLLAFGVVAVGRVTQAQMAVSAVAREAAASAAMANDAAEAIARGTVRGRAVADGYQLSNGTLQFGIDAGSFARGGAVEASAHYDVVLNDLPLLGWVQVPVNSHHRERIDPYRSRRSAGGTR